MNLVQTSELLPPYDFLNCNFYDQAHPAVFPKTILRFRNHNFEEFDHLNEDEWIEIFGLFNSKILPKKKNLALRYHGHQFRVYNPEIGDGRGFTIAQFYKDQKLYDLGTKGSGITKYSRSGDGRLTLKGGIREVLCSCYLDAIGVNTSQSLSLIETGESLYRNDEPSPTRSCVLVRISHSHLRIGTFQYHAYHQDNNNLELLIKSIGKYYFNFNDKNNSPINCFSEIVKRCAELAASYYIYGFVHGVLNTDNINITGESFDYGPFRLMEHYDPNKIAAYFDHSGLYKFASQTDAIFWNVQQLASIFTLFVEQDSLIQELKKYIDYYNDEIFRLFFKRLFLIPSKNKNHNKNLLKDFYNLLLNSNYLYEEIFYDLKGGRQRIKLNNFLKQKYKNFNLERMFDNHESITNMDYEFINSSNVETLLYSDIETIWKQIDKNDDWSLFNLKIDSISKLKRSNQNHGLG